jgi:galactoside O-acetyltransferase
MMAGLRNSFYTKEELEELGLKSYGDNVLISCKASLYGIDKIEIGNNVRIDDFCLLSGSIKIGNNVHIAVATLLHAGSYGIELEDFAGISSRCAIYAQTNDYSGYSLTNPTIPDKYQRELGGKVILRRHVIIGTGSTVLPNVVIGEGSAVGAMSLVNKSIDEWGIYFGIPCHKINNRSKALLEYEKEFRRDGGK